jgi:FKBP-type peptidyl-prolyl cis-trans isomerase
MAGAFIGLARTLQRRTQTMRPAPISLLSAALTLVLVAGSAAAQQSGAITAPAPLAEAPQPAGLDVPLTAYSAVGSDMALANHLDQMGWSEAQVSAFILGIRAAMRGNPFPVEDAAKRVTESITQRGAEIESREREQAFAKPGRLKLYLKDICKRLNLEQSDSGLCYRIQAGAMGARAGPDDTVVVSCAAFASDGATPLPQLTNPNARVKVSDMLPGFVEGIQMMTAGGQAIFVLPPALSFGAGKWPPGVDHGTPILFRIGLTEVISGGTAR